MLSMTWRIVFAACGLTFDAGLVIVGWLWGDPNNAIHYYLVGAACWNAALIFSSIGVSAAVQFLPLPTKAP